MESEVGELMHQNEQELPSVWEGWYWDDNKGGWLDPELCVTVRQEEVEYIRRHKMYTRVSMEVCLRETGRAPIKTGWAETDKGQGSPTCARGWVAKEHKTHARPELHAPTPPLEALKVMLSEIATGKRGGKVVALVDVRRAYFYAPARRRVFVELPPENYQPGDETHVRAVAIQSVRHTRRCTEWGRGAGNYTQQPETCEEKRVPVRVERSQEGGGRCCNRAWK